jgi:hypothetical protein
MKAEFGKTTDILIIINNQETIILDVNITPKEVMQNWMCKFREYNEIENAWKIVNHAFIV